MLIGIVSSLLVLGAVFLAARRVRPQFVIEIREGHARRLRGEVPERFVRDCTEVARITGVQNGRIRGLRRAGTMHLAFSRSIPEAARQPFRNVWPHGQGPGPPTAPRGPSGRRARG